ncbi:MAG: STAS domain-containing protein, partial [Acidobacteria bacterium]|nr:STAS domain-containing protein [Acidobacteriota bacterium]
SANSQAFQSALESGLDTGASLVVLDFERVTIISSAGLRVVLFLAKHLKSRGAKIALCTLSTQIREVMEISGFDRIL